MEIQWLGHACFSIKHKGYTVVIDPYNYKYTYGYPRLNLRADKVLVSHEHYGHNCREAVTLSGKPESQCPFTISAFSVDHDTVGGRMRGTSLVHILEADGLKLVHMGDIGSKPTSASGCCSFRALYSSAASSGSSAGRSSALLW